jgi:hypothetical protein
MTNVIIVNNKIYIKLKIMGCNIMVRNFKLIVFTCLLFIISANRISAQWVQNNGLYGGNINCFTTMSDGAGGTNILAGTPNGFFVSTDKGESWSKINTGNIDGYGSDIIALASIGTDLFASTDYGVSLSTDNGVSWTDTGLPQSASCLAVSGTNLFAGTENNGVYLSSDYGASWAKVSNGLIGSYANYVTSLAVNGNYIFAGTRDGVYRSTNNGTSWDTANTGMRSSTYVIALIVIPNGTNGTTIIAGTEQGTYLSNNNGNNWTYISTNTGLPYEYIDAFAAIPNGKGGTNLFAGSQNDEISLSGLFLSTDNGNNWSRISIGLPEISCVSALCVTGTNIVAGLFGGSVVGYGNSGKGIFLSTDNGSNWNCTGLPSTDNVTSFAISAENLFAGTKGDGIFISTNNGVSWTNTGNLLNDQGFTFITYVSSICVSGTNLLAGTDNYNGGVYLSTDKGATWSNIWSGSPVHTLTISGSSIFAGTDAGVYRSTNNGVSWGKVSTGLPANSSVNAFAINGTNIFAGTNVSGVFLSTNNGTNWNAVNTSMTDINIYALAISGNNLFAGTGGGGVNISTDNGTNWVAADSGLPANSSIYSLTVNGTSIFVGTSGHGVYQSTNNGISWVKANVGLANSSIHALAISGTTLFAGTDSSGVWMRPMSELTSVIELQGNELLRRYSLNQNYPNPFNPSTVIEYQLPKDGYVTLKVYDILGREVRALVNGYKTVGKYSVNFDASKLASGVYIYQLKSNNYSSIKKMILAK